jgi:hypothetical protein
MLKGNTLLKELDVSSSGEGMSSWETDGSGFAKELAVGIKDNGAMTCLDLSKNNIGKHPEGWETGSDKAGNKFYRPRGGEWQRSLPAADAIITLANAIRALGALTSLNLADNSIGGSYDGNLQKRGGTPEGFTFWPAIFQLSIALTFALFAGPAAIANAIRAMRALIRLDISNNSIGAEQKESLEQICMASGIDLAM